MSDYLTLLWIGLSSSILFAFIGLFVGLGLVFLLKKRHYLERKHPFLKVVTKLYFIYFPFVFFFAFWFSGSLWTSGQLFEKEVREVIIDIEDKTYPIFIKFVNERVDAFLALQSLPTNHEIVSIFVAENVDESTSGIYQYCMKTCLTMMLEHMIGKDSEREKRREILSEGISSNLFKVGFSFLKEEVKSSIKRILMVLLIPVIIGFLGAMCFPVVEIFIFNKFNARS